MKNNTVVDRDNGLKLFFKKLKEINQTVSVGVQAEDAAAMRDGITNGELATIHEFGAPEQNIPERSFLRSTADRNRGKYSAMLEKVAEKRDIRALVALGEVARSDIVKTIRAGIAPELAESTIRAKNDTLPLVDTGQLVNSITVRVSK